MNLFNRKKGKEVKIVYRKIFELIPAEYNPRKMSKDQFEALKKSMQSLGDLAPAVINMYAGRENIIIAGHQRLKVAVEIGMDEYPCLEVKFDPKKEKEANIRMNASGGSWDFDMLKTNFDLDDLKTWDLSDMKFDIEPEKPLTHVKSKVIQCPHCQKEIEMVKGKVKA